MELNGSVLIPSKRENYDGVYESIERFFTRGRERPIRRKIITLEDWNEGKEFYS